MNDQFEQELSDAIGQRNKAWHYERIGRFTSSKFGELVKEGKAATKQRRQRLEKDFENGEVTEAVYKREMADIEYIEYEARFGDGCKTYVYSKIAEILTNSVHETGGSMATEWGTDQEANAVFAYQEKTGKKVKPAGFVKYGELAGGSPDGFVVNESGIIEVKCPFNPANHIRLIITGQIPQAHYWQVHGNILVTDSKYCDYVSYDPRMLDEKFKLHIIRVERDDHVLQQIKDRINEVAEYMDKIIPKQMNSQTKLNL